MSLVAYGSSSDDSEDETYAKKQEPTAINKKQKVKITIPSLKEFETDESEIPKKKTKYQSSGSGLLNLLPPPKNASPLTKPGFVPHVLKSKKEEKLPVPVKKVESVDNEPETSCVPNPVEHDSDEETYEKDKASKETNHIDFFSLDDSKKQITTTDFSKYLLETSPTESPGNDKLPFQSHQSELQHSSSLSVQHSSFEKEPEKVSYSELQYQQSSLSNEDADMSFSPGYSSESANSSGFCTQPAAEQDPKELLLNDERFLRLQGRRHKIEDVDIIDVNGSELLTDKNQWLMKSLTEETTHRPSSKKHGMPTQQQKRKHQITYLAFQAKEREMDLKNQWALNSRTRRETQAKYGF